MFDTTPSEFKMFDEESKEFKAPSEFKTDEKFKNKEESGIT